jgi:glycosyltransferase involved in cell wall biosynthesis
MKVVILCPDFPPKTSGIGDYTNLLSQELANLVEEVVIITSLQFTEGSIKAERLNQQVTVLPIIKRWNIFSVRQLFQAIKREVPDLVNIQYATFLYERKGIPLLASLIACVLKTLTKIKIVTTFHETYLERDFIHHKLSLGTFLKQCLRALVQRISASVLVFFSDESILTTQKRMRRFQKLFKKKAPHIHCIPVTSGIRVHEHREKVRSQVRARLGISPNQIVLTKFGTLHNTQNYEMAVRCLAKLKKLGFEKIILLFIGHVTKNNPGYIYITKLAEYLNVSKQIIWTGKLSEGEVSFHLSAADIGLLLYTNGVATTRSILPALLGHGLPAVATPGCETDEWLLNSGSLIFVKNDDISALASAVIQLIQSPEIRVELSQKAEEVYQKHFSLSQAALHTYEIYKSALND